MFLPCSSCGCCISVAETSVESRESGLPNVVLRDVIASRTRKFLGCHVRGSDRYLGYAGAIEDNVCESLWGHVQTAGDSKPHVTNSNSHPIVVYAHGCGEARPADLQGKYVDNGGSDDNNSVDH